MSFKRIFHGLAGAGLVGVILIGGQQSLLASEQTKVIAVGLHQAVKTLAEAARLAKDGDVIEVESADYLRDVAIWTQNDISIRAKNGRVRLLADGAAAEEKAIWVIRAGRVRIEGFDFIGAAVPNRNGAGIRLEKGQLSIQDCRFMNNENGILTSGDANSTLEIENSEFGHNGFGDGQSHNLYVGTIASLKVTGSYFHHAKVGHLLKSRAAKNYILYNRLTDEKGGMASYELEFPNGGLAYVLGNIIEQSATTENPHVISFGAEGYRMPSNRLYLVNNTLLDQRPQGGKFLRAGPGAEVFAINNLLFGSGALESAAPGIYQNNFNVDSAAFVSVIRDDYHLQSDSNLRGKAVVVDAVDGIDLVPTAEYRHPRSIRMITNASLSPGAMQQ